MYKENKKSKVNQQHGNYPGLLNKPSTNLIQTLTQIKTCRKWRESYKKKNKKIMYNLFVYIYIICIEENITKIGHKSDTMIDFHQMFVMIFSHWENNSIYMAYILDKLIWFFICKKKKSNSILKCWKKNHIRFSYWKVFKLKIWKLVQGRN